jgi:hypothetical protein
MTATKPPEVGLGNEGIKIILYRVNVGHEGDVVAMLRNHLERDKHAVNSNLIQYKIYKVLGLYDIMIIMQVRDFIHDLLRKGSFEQVILGNEILCFTFFTKQTQQHIFSELSKQGIFITLIKLQLEPLLTFGNVLPKAVAQFMEKQEHVLVIGGLGWNELISIYPHDFTKAQLHDIFHRFMRKTSSLSIASKNERIPLVQKTYSFMGVSYEVIDSLEETFPNLFEEGEPCPRLHLSVTADNFNLIYRKITTSFPIEEFKYDRPMVMMGVYDISIPFKEGSWGRFLDRVIKFRKDNAGFILDTRIDLGSPMEDNNSPTATEKTRQKFPFLNLPEPHTAAILDKPGTAHVISTIYCFNHFIQNPLLQESFLDLYLPARKLISEVYTGGKHGNLMLTKQMVSQLLSEFQWAMRERAMGAYLFTEGDEHSFSPIKGGLQKIILALESIPFSLLTKLGSSREIPWQGFVSIGLKYEPVHFMENIHIPFEHILYPEKFWWCLIHETGHILTLVSNILHKNNPIIEEAISRIPNIDKSSLDFYKNMADNCFADAFDFIIGFLGNRDLYFRRCWPFLLDNLEGEDNPREFFMRHLVRHFFGWLYEGKYMSKKIPNLRLEDVDLRRTEAAAFLQSLEDIPGMKDRINEFGANREKFARKICLDTAPYLFLMDHFHKYLGPALELHEKLKEEYNSEKFNEIIVSLQNDGAIIPHKDIKYPHLIPLKLMDNWVTTGQELPFRSRIATILSLYWYSHHNFLPTIFNAYREAQSLQVQPSSTH